MHIALSGQYASWAGTLVGLDTPIILVAEDPERLAESRMRLARVGVEKIVGCLDGGVLAWERSGRLLNQTPQVSVLDLYEQLSRRSNEIQLVDVRRPMEWEAGHIAQAALKPLNQLARLTGDLDPAKPVFVHCKSGFRSSIATSLLERAGFRSIVNVVGGFDAWQAQKLPEIQPKSACEAASASQPAAMRGS